MDWSKPYTSRWRLYRLDPDTWAEAEEVGKVKSAKFERGGSTYDSQTGTINVVVPIGTDMTDRYYRLVLNAEQDGGWRRENVATMFCTDVSGTDQNKTSTLVMHMESVLYPASVMTVKDGTFLPRGSSAVAWCQLLLSDVLKAPMSGVGSFALAGSYVFEDGMSILDAVRTILSLGGYGLRITASGGVQMRPIPTEPSAEFIYGDEVMLQESTSWTRAKAKVPNRYIAVDGGARAEAVNSSAGSETSTVSRGYYKDEYDGSPHPLDGETLRAYARRRLVEMSVITEQRTYKRKWMTDVLPNDVIAAGLSSVGYSGLIVPYRVVRQSIECTEQRVIVQETVQKETQTWQ